MVSYPLTLSRSHPSHALTPLTLSLLSRSHPSHPSSPFLPRLCLSLLLFFLLFILTYKDILRMAETKESLIAPPEHIIQMPDQVHSISTSVPPPSPSLPFLSHLFLLFLLLIVFSSLAFRLNQIHPDPLSLSAPLLLLLLLSLSASLLLLLPLFLLLPPLSLLPLFSLLPSPLIHAGSC